MPTSASLVRLLAAAFLAIVVAGCGSGKAPLAPVRGKVYYRGAPLPGGTIVFTPDESRGGNGPLARSEIQPDGAFTLRTGDQPGAAAGWYRITVVAVEPSPVLAAGQRFAAPRSLLPDKYRDPELSGLRCEVRPGRENGFNFNLE